ncbi:MAG: lysylphosphatidylglycerol synthase transmembrane domain-containing protein [Candidatus Hodarchaeota archaeon]
MRTLLKLLVSLALLGVAFYYLDWASLKEALLEVNLWVFIVSTLIFASHYILLALRWHLLLDSNIILPLKENVRIYLYSIFLNTFTPVNVGGDIYRFFSLKDQTPDKLTVIVLILKERILGILGCFSVYLILFAGLWLTNTKWLLNSGKVLFYPGVLMLFGTIWIILIPYVLRIISKLRSVCDRTRFYNSVVSLYDAMYFNSLPHFAKLMGLSFLSLLIWILAVQIFAIDLRLHISCWYVGTIAILVELVRLIPITIQGVGLREGTYAYLFDILGKSPEDGFVLGTVSYL